jgi:transcription elongation factor GreA
MFWAQEERGEEVILTPDGYKKLRRKSKNVDRAATRVADRICIARESAISPRTRNTISARTTSSPRGACGSRSGLRMRVVTKKEIRSGEISVGTTVRLKDMGSNKTVEYHIVGSAEADPAELKLSNESPVGKAIMGHKKGDVVEAPTPKGAKKFKIMEVKAA